MAEILPALDSEAPAGYLPANENGKLLPPGGKELPVGGKTSADPSEARSRQDSPAETGFNSPTLKPAPDKAGAPNTTQHQIDGELAAGLKAIADRTGPAAKPRQPVNSATLPNADIAAKSVPTLTGAISRDRLARVTLQPEHVNAPATPSGSESSLRQIASLITPVTATENTSLGLQLSGQATSVSPAPLHIGPASQTAMGAYDFEGMVDRLLDAREAAQSGQAGRAQMAVQHDDFGQVSIKLMSAAAGLKFSLSSIDPDFAPAV
ncbi:hypothetical protein N8940_02610, partial [Sphingomonadaceae bacterium]|nr:hypothetical protein [Sphingomonadaceae bacterium]